MRKKATLDARRAQLTGTLLRRQHRKMERTLAVEGTAYQQNHASLVARMPAIERQLAALEATAKRLDDPRDALLAEAGGGGGDESAAAVEVQFKSLTALQVCERVAGWAGRRWDSFEGVWLREVARTCLTPSLSTHCIGMRNCRQQQHCLVSLACIA
jgi:hypothetical protein